MRVHIDGCTVRDRTLKRIRSYIDSEISKLQRGDFSPAPGLREAIRTFIWWVIPAMALVEYTMWCSRVGGAEHLAAAIEEGIGVNLWNVMGSIGIALLGLLIIAPGSRFASDASKNVLMNTYAIGCLSLGLLMGQGEYAVRTSWGVDEEFGWETGGLLHRMLMAVGINAFVWYIGFHSGSVQARPEFRARLANLGIVFRLALGGVVLGVSIGVLVCSE